MNNFDTELKERTAYVEKIVYDYCPKEEGLQKIIIEAMNYNLKKIKTNACFGNIKIVWRR